jgi:hypothetical protein
VFDRPWQIVAEALNKKARIPDEVEVPATQVAAHRRRAAAAISPDLPAFSGQCSSRHESALATGGPFAAISTKKPVID